jgi:RNA polymerase sigma factor (TIGR02999 family)
MTDTDNPPPSGQITELLRRWSDGQNESLEPLFNLVYPRLRQIANALFRGESPDSLLQPTSVVNELFIKLVRQHSLQFENREHFFSLAASLMRRILVDHARSERAAKRDGGIKVPLEDELAWVSTLPSADLLDIDRALLELQQLDPRKSRMVELRFLPWRHLRRDRGAAADVESHGRSRAQVCPRLALPAPAIRSGARSLAP